MQSKKKPPVSSRVSYFAINFSYYSPLSVFFSSSLFSSFQINNYSSAWNLRASDGDVDGTERDAAEKIYIFVHRQSINCTSIFFLTFQLLSRSLALLLQISYIYFSSSDFCTRNLSLFAHKFHKFFYISSFSALIFYSKFQLYHTLSTTEKSHFLLAEWEMITYQSTSRWRWNEFL